MLERPNQISVIQAGNADASITIQTRGRHLAMCYVFDHELESIGSANSKVSLDVALFGVSAGALIAFAITLATVEITSPFVFATFCGLAAISLISTVFFGGRFLISRNESKTQINRILEESKQRGTEHL